jgi:hypothetical protein
MADEPLTPEEFDDLNHPVSPVEFDAGERKTWDDPDNPIAPMADADPPAADADPPAKMEGLEDVPPEEEGGDPEEEKPPVQKLVRQTQLKLPGKKGPLVVDSIGDYLEEADWNAVDEAAREAAELAKPKSGDPEPGGDPDGAPPPPLPPEPVGDIGEPGEPVDPPVGDIGEPGEPVDPLVGDIGVSGEPVDPPVGAAVVSAQPPTTSTSTASTSTTTSSAELGNDTNPPPSPEANSAQLAAQKDFEITPQTAFSLPGNDQTTKNVSLEQATDSIKTSTAAMVNILNVFAQVMNVHARSIAQLEDQLDMDGERDVS